MGKLLLDGRKSVDITEAVTTWNDNPEFALGSEDFKSIPGRIVSSFLLHTTRGTWPPQPPPGDIGPGGQGAENNARYWRRDKRSASAALLVDTDGSVVQTHFLVPIVAWHARTASMRSIGIEHVQEASGRVYAVQWRTTANLIHALIQSKHPQIKIQEPDGSIRVRVNYNVRKPIQLPPDWRGVLGHRDTDTRNRGRGDPGDYIMAGVADSLAALGYNVVRV